MFWVLMSREKTGGNEINFSQRAETFYASGKGAGNFLKVIADPFEVKEGESQKIVLVLQNPGDIKSLNAILNDGEGSHEKQFKQILLQKDKNQAFYQIIWRPQALQPGKSYQTTFEYLTTSGKKNKISFLWHSAEILNKPKI